MLLANFLNYKDCISSSELVRGNTKTLLLNNNNYLFCEMIIGSICFSSSLINVEEGNRYTPFLPGVVSILT